MENQEQKEIQKVEPKTVQYCGVCGVPPEYCEFGKKFKKCKVWMQQNAPEIYEKLPEDLKKESKDKKDDEEKKNEGEKSKEGQEAPKEETKTEEAPKKKKKVKNTAQGAGEQITVTVQKRMGKKRITLIMGLLEFGLNLKDVSKKCSKKFACSSTVLEDKFIEIQGDVADMVMPFFLQEFKTLVTEQMFTINHFEEAPKIPSTHKGKKRLKDLEKEAQEEAESGIQNV